MEALINAFSSIFTYSNYTIYNIKNRNQESDLINSQKYLNTL